VQAGHGFQTVDRLDDVVANQDGGQVGDHLFIVLLVVIGI
jgi:hypothetical protein